MEKIYYFCSMIFYFSATGNTRWAVQKICEATGEKSFFIPNMEKEDCVYSLEKDEYLGFCFPVHGWRPPKNVRKFIKQLTIEQANNNYCFALCTAGDNIGETMDIFRQDLAEREIHLNAAFSLIMPESYVGLPFMDVDNPTKEKEKKAKANEILECCIQDIIQRKNGIERLVIGNWPRINSRVLGGYFINHLITDKKFHVKEEQCVKCGTCVSVCPIGNMDGGKGILPSWKHTGDCLTCFACYHHCPQHAIEFGRQTKKKGQYYYKKE